MRWVRRGGFAAGRHRAHLAAVRGHALPSCPAGGGLSAATACCRAADCRRGGQAGGHGRHCHPPADPVRRHGRRLRLGPGEARRRRGFGADGLPGGPPARLSVAVLLAENGGSPLRGGAGGGRSAAPVLLCPRAGDALLPDAPHRAFDYHTRRPERHDAGGAVLADVEGGLETEASRGVYPRGCVHTPLPMPSRNPVAHRAPCEARSPSALPPLPGARGYAGQPRG